MSARRCRYCGGDFGDLVLSTPDGWLECWDLRRCARHAGMSREQILDAEDARKAAGVAGGCYAERSEDEGADQLAVTGSALTAFGVRTE